MLAGVSVKGLMVQCWLVSLLKDTAWVGLTRCLMNCVFDLFKVSKTYIEPRHPNNNNNNNPSNAYIIAKCTMLVLTQRNDPWFD